MNQSQRSAALFGVVLATFLIAAGSALELRMDPAEESVGAEGQPPDRAAADLGRVEGLGGSPRH